MVDSIEADEHNASAIGCFSSLDSAQNHLIIMCKDTSNIRLSLENIVKYSQVFITVEVGCLLSDDRDTVAAGRHIVIEALAAWATQGSGDTLQATTLP